MRLIRMLVACIDQLLTCTSQSQSGLVPLRLICPRAHSTRLLPRAVHEPARQLSIPASIQYFSRGDAGIGFIY